MGLCIMLQKIILKNGVRIVAEHIPHVRSASIGLWFGVGVRNEKPIENGASHFIEHLLFKGTQTRTAAQLAFDMDKIGGQMNAFTTRECTCFYARVLDSHIQTTVDLLTDMLFCSNFHQADIDSERGIIFEEIDMYEDTPEELVSEQLMGVVFPHHALGQPILGTKKTLKKLNRSKILRYMKEHYTPNRLVIAISGQFSDADLSYIESAFSHMPTGATITDEQAVYVPGFTLREKTIEQNHLCLFLPGLSIQSPNRYAGQLLANILGGGVSSRLFQSVRETHGLCYNIYSFGESYFDTGLLGIYAALGKDTELDALAFIVTILKNLYENGVTAEELDCAREQVKSSVLLGLESTATRMNHLGKNELFKGEIPTPQEMISRYDAVTTADILDTARQMLAFEKLSFSAVGQVKSEGQYRDLIGGLVK